MPRIQEFMESIHCYSVKAKSSNKTDIKIVVHDSRTGLQPTLGFSIKSEVGAASTIFNTNGDKTNFLYRISGISAADARAINGIGKFQAKFQRLSELNAETEFTGIVGKILRNNLNYADGHLPAILGQMILLYYSTSLSKIREITERIKAENPLAFDYSDNQDFYEHKIKRLLTECTLGLKGTTVWCGKYEATGGYLIVKEDGEVICYHIYDRNRFENYLFNNTRFDTPSTGRHKFGNIYQENGAFYIKLNLQIRFL